MSRKGNNRRYRSSGQNMKQRCRKRKIMIIKLCLCAAVLAILGGTVWGIASNIQKKKAKEEKQKTELAEKEKKEDEEKRKIIETAKIMGGGYDYEGAIELLKGIEGYEKDEEVTKVIAGFEAAKTTLVEVDINDITHIFYHSLIVDTDRALHGKDERQSGQYNQVMTTVDEFNKITQQMYDKGYVLISLHDMVEQKTDESGAVHFTPAKIMLPEGKKPFVLSVDDVSYYEYMEGTGFATKLIIDKNGKVKNEYLKEDGSVDVGDFDVIPLLDKFVEEHPDAAYKGAKGTIALTGYNGVLGYRTDESYAANPNFQQECEEAKKVADAMKASGWEFASHSWGHKNYGSMSFDKFKEDADKWQKNVPPIIGATDILIFPFGADIGDWRDYSGERYDYLKSQGFNIYCNVDSKNSAWVQLRDGYIRQGRRNLDGYRMYYDMIDDSIDKLSDLFDVNSVFDQNRPTPVPEM